jgi:hypothetical protein
VPCSWSASIAISASSRNSILAPTPKTGSHRGEERYLGFLLARSREVRTPLEGDIVLFRVGRCFAHAGIASRVAPLAIIHAFSAAHCVVEDIIQNSAELSARMKTAKFASIWGEEC